VGKEKEKTYCAKNIKVGLFVLTVTYKMAQNGASSLGFNPILQLESIL